ncbi:MAG: hypothetical protein V7L20_13080 [Nostoc sp.]|uniref:calcium-binding protein n=1 Tax=Nostoc sp. TaxID=1180 RepID=UPI002FF8184C
MPTINGTNFSDNLSVPFFSNLPYIINGFDSNDTITGGSGDSTINGGLGNDSLLGGFGLGNQNSSIDGGAGNDTITGGSGNNSLLGGEGDDSLLGGFGLDNQNSIDGGAGNDTITGGSGNNSLLGGEGDDSLLGGFGNDTLIGGAGTDTLTGGFGNDVFKFNSVSESKPGVLRDVITDFEGGLSDFDPDQIDLSTIDGNSTIAGKQAFTFIGASAFSAPGQVRYSGDILQANTDQNLSADFEIQLIGTPPLIASDIIFNDSGDFSFSSTDSSSSSDNSSSSSGDNSSSSSSSSSSGNSTFNVSGGNSTLIGGNGNDTFNIGSDKDSLIGSAGNDVLTGGLGNDIFKFNSVSDSPPGLSRDVITDFVGNGNLPGDQIDLSSIDANSTIAGKQAFTFIGTRPFSAVGQIRYAAGILQGNTAGNLSANFEIQLTGAPPLVASDIIL